MNTISNSHGLPIIFGSFRMPKDTPHLRQVLDNIKSTCVSIGTGHGEGGKQMHFASKRLEQLWGVK